VLIRAQALFKEADAQQDGVLTEVRWPQKYQWVPYAS
jgi:hypothetical protein